MRRWPPAPRLGLAAAALLITAQPISAQTSADQAAAELRARWDLDVRWGKTGFGPVTFPLPSNVAAVPLHDRDALAAMVVIRTALSAYSDSFVREHAALPMLLCQELTVNGATIGGLVRACLAAQRTAVMSGACMVWWS